MTAREGERGKERDRGRGREIGRERERERDRERGGRGYHMRGRVPYDGEATI